MKEHKILTSSDDVRDQIKAYIEEFGIKSSRIAESMGISKSNFKRILDKQRGLKPDVLAGINNYLKTDFKLPEDGTNNQQEERTDDRG